MRHSIGCGCAIASITTIEEVFGAGQLSVRLPLHLAGVDLGPNVQGHRAIGHLRVGLLHGTDQLGAGGVGGQVLLKGQQIVLGEGNGADV